jgi:hypothetical protein
MNMNADVLVNVIANYQAPYPDPIRVNAGDEVAIDTDKTTDISGWVWCTNRAGKSGWVPEAYMERKGKSGFLRCDYYAIELTIHAGDLLTVHKLESGFYWASDRSGRQGWVPATHVEPYRRGKGSEAK